MKKKRAVAIGCDAVCFTRVQIVIM